MTLVQLDPDICYRALQTRDARFDGRFFTAVRTTRVYCRPICPALTPRRENCLFLPCAAAAQEAGYRPCLRCRPEASPGTPAWLGTCVTVTRALRLIEDGALDRGPVDALAERLGIGSRHLRRLFLRHLGATPVAVAQTRRVLFAKKLLDETTLPMTEVAHAAGFQSIRRFNDAIRATYGTAPTALRRKGGRRAPVASEIALVLPYRPPYPWDALRAYLAARAIPGVECVDGDAYRRSVCLATAGGGDVTGIVEVRAAPDGHHLRARLRLSSSGELAGVAERLRRLFDLGADPLEIGAHLRRDARLARRIETLPGVRVPGAWDGFELAVRSILGQQVTVRGASSLAGRLVRTFGRPLPGAGPGARPADPAWLFPSPDALAAADLAAVGLPRARADAISGLARAVADGAIALDGSRPPEETLVALRAVPGIGAWTAQMVAMRALREPDAFPAGDLGLRRAFAAVEPARGSDPPPVPERTLRDAAEAWRPWRAYAAMLLWLAPTGAPARGRPARATTSSRARASRTSGNRARRAAGRTR